MTGQGNRALAAAHHLPTCEIQIRADARTAPQPVTLRGACVVYTTTDHLCEVPRSLQVLWEKREGLGQGTDSAVAKGVVDSAVNHVAT